ncbi:peptidoglycan -binding protein [Telmatospirillum sp. J64-1]|uniref:peptidoglycan -binding protein n=1 Tax=Telmatospirillum sp. J64-1 TaxID=2502183 RepID=UPI00115D9D8B|nr:peptidoglycan -binding protein [Telmatospirillum sp. J64-1]
MASIGRRARRTTDIWPGFVDALATLLMVIIFLLMIFALAQFFMGQALSGRDEALSRLSRQMNELSELLSLERQANADLRLNVAQLSSELQSSVAERERLALRLSEAEAAAETVDVQMREIALLKHDVEALEALRIELERQIAEMGAKLGESEGQLAEERRLSDEARAHAALLNQQLETLRQEIARLAAALDASEALAAEQRIEIANLGSRLNQALASKVEELARYRSEFFGRLRQVLGNKPGIRIEGDRFVFQSELLFDSASADLGNAGRQEVTQLAETLKTIAREIPTDVNWVLRVDGHTDRLPIRSGRYESNWELSTARALAVVKHLIDQGVPADRLAAAGFGEYHPIDTGNTPAALARNRRIELRLDQR